MSPSDVCVKLYNSLSSFISHLRKLRGVGCAIVSGEVGMLWMRVKSQTTHLEHAWIPVSSVHFHFDHWYVKRPCVQGIKKNFPRHISRISRRVNLDVVAVCFSPEINKND
jgi:hypothetical protein